MSPQEATALWVGCFAVGVVAAMARITIACGALFIVSATLVGSFYYLIARKWRQLWNPVVFVILAAGAVAFFQFLYVKKFNLVDVSIILVDGYLATAVGYSLACRFAFRRRR